MCDSDSTIAIVSQSCKNACSRCRCHCRCCRRRRRCCCCRRRVHWVRNTKTAAAYDGHQQEGRMMGGGRRSVEVPASQPVSQPASKQAGRQAGRQAKAISGGASLRQACCRLKGRNCWKADQTPNRGTGEYRMTATVGRARETDMEKGDTSRDRRQEAKAAQTNNASRCAVVKFSFSSLPFLCATAATCAQGVCVCEEGIEGVSNAISCASCCVEELRCFCSMPRNTHKFASQTPIKLWAGHSKFPFRWLQN